MVKLTATELSVISVLCSQFMTVLNVTSNCSFISNVTESVSRLSQFYILYFCNICAHAFSCKHCIS